MRSGYTGKHITIASKENVIEGIFKDVFYMKSKPNTESNRKNTTISHGTSVMDFISQVAPDSLKYALAISGKTKNGILYSEEIDFMLKNTPDILTTSTFNSSDKAESHISKYRELYNKGCFLCCAAGNDNDEGLNSLTKNDLWIAIGSVRYPKLNKATYSSVGEELDYMSFDNLVASWDLKKKTGTSFASPLFAGMIALVQDFFIIKTGKKLSHEKLLNFINDNCMDLGDKEKDIKYGHGLFILPDPEEIDIKKYTDIEITEEAEKRYKLLKDVPTGEFHEVIKDLIDRGIIKGYSGSGEDTVVDLSLDMIRMFVINNRAGIYKI